MKPTTIKLLRLLHAAGPERQFEAIAAASSTGDDRIRVTERHWLNVDWHDGPDDPPMVTLTDDTPDTGGQIGFWVVNNPDALSSVVRAALEVQTGFGRGHTQPNPDRLC